MNSPQSQPRRKRRSALVIAGIVSLLLLAGLLKLGGDRWREQALIQAEQDLNAGRPAAARDRLAGVARLWPNDPDILFMKGACALAEGNADAAMELWSQVPQTSRHWIEVCVRSAQIALDQGRFADAERLLLTAKPPVGHPAFEASQQILRQLYLFTIRYDEIERMTIAAWNRAKTTESLRILWLLDDAKSFAVSATRDRLDQAGKSAPDDDRVWLGKANLAIRTGHRDEADAWLKRCLERKSDDPAVWLARLDWCLMFDQVDAAAEACRRLPSSALSLPRLLALRAWLAGRRDQVRAEREAIEELLIHQPGNTKALTRLADLAFRVGQEALVAELRQKKREVDLANDHYRMLLTDDSYLKSAAVRGESIENHEEGLAGDAERLGRWFEAKGWWSLVLERSPASKTAREAVDRLDRAEQERGARPIAANQRTHRELNELVADLIGGKTSPTQASDERSLAMAVPQFTDDAARAGLRFTYENDPTPRCRMPETMGGGVGLIDYDGDGWLDVYAVQGGPLPDTLPLPPITQRDRLFRNRGDGTFEDATERAGLSGFPGGYGHGVTVGDYDNDGRPDLFVTRWRSYALYRNKGDGTFENATERSGLGGDRDWPTSAAFADLDGDGDLDLYVCHYNAWDPRSSEPCPHASDPNKFMYCGPRMFAAQPDHLFRNDGGRFVDVSESAGITAADTEGRGLGVVAADLDGDGRTDLFVANDLTANFLFRNLGDFRFEEVAMLSGVATNAVGGYLAGMGVACGDLDGDGLVDLGVTNFYGESTTFYRNLGGGQFADQTASSGLATASRYLLGFGLAFLDVNNDGRLDLASANGHVNDLRPNVPYAMPCQLLLTEEGGRFHDVTREAGKAWSVPRLGRGLAAGDLDNDGKLDLLVVSEGEPLAYLHHEGPAGRFVTFQLEGDGAKSNRDGNGAVVTVTSNGRRQVAQRTGGGSFLSASDSRLHFGLGDEPRIDAVEVRWPSGRIDRHEHLAADTAYRLREGSAPMPLAGWEKNR